MTDKDIQDSGTNSAEAATLTDAEIISVRLPVRRSFMKTIGVAILGVTATMIAWQRSARASDFPKGSSDNDVTINGDLKAQDSDGNDAQADSDRSQLRDVRRSGDSD